MHLYTFEDLKGLKVTFAASLRVCMAGCCMFLPLADLVACIRSPRALVTSFTALISITWSKEAIID